MKKKKRTEYLLEILVIDSDYLIQMMTYVDPEIQFSEYDWLDPTLLNTSTYNFLWKLPFVSFPCQKVLLIARRKDICLAHCKWGIHFELSF